MVCFFFFIRNKHWTKNQSKFISIILDLFIEHIIGMLMIKEMMRTIPIYRDYKDDF